MPELRELIFNEFEKMRTDFDKKLKELWDKIRGNGQPGMDDQIRDNYKIIIKHGKDIEEVKRDVDEIKQVVHDIVIIFKTIRWALIVGGVVVLVLSSFFGWNIHNQFADIQKSIRGLVP